MTQEQILSDIVDFEMGSLGRRDTLVLFGELVKTGMAWTLQGTYGRMADELITIGLITPQGQVNWNEWKDDTEDTDY